VGAKGQDQDRRAGGRFPANRPRCEQSNSARSSRSRIGQGIQRSWLRLGVGAQDDQAKPEVGVANAATWCDPDVLVIVRHFTPASPFLPPKFYKRRYVDDDFPANTATEITDRGYRTSIACAAATTSKGPSAPVSRARF